MTLQTSDSPFRDQRTMVDVSGPAGILQTVDDVEQAWQRWADREGLGWRIRRGDHSTDLHSSRKTVQAYISGGKWIADCPNCNGGIACWRDNPRGCCLDCGTIYRVDHPSETEEKRATEILLARANPEARHWHRHRGETLDDLEAENEKLELAQPDGVVAADEIIRVLGKSALAKLQKEGVL
jgi:hypothetical protein